MVASHCALFRPDLFSALILMSVPYTPRGWGHTPPTEKMREMAGENVFYMNYFQEPGKAEREFEASARKSILGSLYSGSADPPPESRWRFIFGPDETLKASTTLPKTLPAWLTEADLDFYAAAFERTGFRGGLNWYRNMDRNWALTPFLSKARILQPTLFLAGQEDAVITFMRKGYERMEAHVPDLRGKVLIPGAGHWVQQEKPQAVNDQMIDFLRGLS
jgi:pimeloyl-ACP methyl ester carboxylesterase